MYPILQKRMVRAALVGTLLLLLLPTLSAVDVPVAILQRMSDGRFTTAAACEMPNSWSASSDGMALSEFWQAQEPALGTCWLDSTWKAVAVAGLAAVHDFNERVGTFAPALGSDTVRACDKQITVSLLDSGSTGPAALVEFIEALYSTTPPIALIGPARSAASKSVAGLAGVKDVPQASRAAPPLRKRNPSRPEPACIAECLADLVRVNERRA